MSEPQPKQFNWYEVSIRWCYYALKHNNSWWNPLGWFAGIGLIVLALPFAFYFKIKGKTPPDLELI